MAGDKATLELVGVVEDQGRYLFTKWREASKKPEGFAQFRAFVTSIDDFSNFVDLVEGRILDAKLDRREDILHYLTQLRLQIITQKLDLMGELLAGIRQSHLPIPLGSQPFFQGVREWIRALRRINDRSLKEHGSTPIDPELVAKTDRLLKWAAANSKDLQPLVVEGRVVGRMQQVQSTTRRRTRGD